MNYPESEQLSPKMSELFQQMITNLEKRNLRQDITENYIKNNLGVLKSLDDFIEQNGEETLETKLGINPYRAYIKQDPKFLREFGNFIIETTDLPVPKSTNTEIIHIGKVPARWIIPEEAKENKDYVLLHLHGGAYVGGSVRMPGNLIIPYRVAQASKVPVLMLNYGLAPKRPYPVGLNDTVNAYKWLLSEGNKPENIIIWGESAGGGLTIATLLKLRDLNLPLPKAGVALSPWVDLAFEGESYQTRKDQDAVLTLEGLSESAKLYLNGVDPYNPYISPLYADLTGLPSLYIEAGDYEVFVDEVTNLVKKAEEAGVDVLYHLYPEMPHVHQSLDLSIPEVQTSIQNIGQYVRKHFNLL